LVFHDFSLDKQPIDVQWKENAKSGGWMLDMVIGAFVALVFLGLPLAIIGLFIASTLDRFLSLFMISASTLVHPCRWLYTWRRNPEAL
jgi:hypothetical protein